MVIRYTASFSRSILEQEEPFEIGYDDWLISIAGYDMIPAKIKIPLERIIFIHFDNIEEISEKAITKQQAKFISDFIEMALDVDKNVWVSCHTQDLRCFNAIVKVLTNIGWKATKTFNPQGTFNRLVFDLVSQHLVQPLNNHKGE